MATIALYAGKINQMPGLVRNVKASVTDYKAELSALRTKIMTINSSVCNMDDVVSSIQSASQTQERKITSLAEFDRSSEDFAAEAAAIDGKAADIVRQRKEDFYQQYAYLRPEREQKLWDKVKDGLQTAGQWCREHWKLVVAAVVVIVAVVVLCILFPAAIPFVVSIAEGALKGALIGGLIGGGMNALLGESFWEGFKTGALWGALFGGIGGAGKAFASCCQLINALGGVKKVFPVIAKIAKLSGTLSVVMGGFDLLAFGVRLFNSSSPLVAFNQKLHSNGLYNAVQFTVSAVAAFSTAAYLRMKQGPPVCFVAGTMVLTAAGLTAIENIRAGDRVVSTNPDTFETEEKRVLETYVREVRQLVHLTVNGELISTTVNHPFWVKGKGFVGAGELKAGDELVRASSVNGVLADMVSADGTLVDVAGGSCVIENVRFEIVERPERVYNFQVEDFHTYYVGSSGVLVHNAECGGEGGTVAEGEAVPEGGSKSGAGEYAAPSGGGGITSTIKANGQTVNFGHGGRHLEGTGLNVDAVNQALANEVSTLNLGIGQFHKGQIIVDGITIEYTSYGVSEGIINVGTYYPLQ